MVIVKVLCRGNFVLQFHFQIAMLFVDLIMPSMCYYESLPAWINRIHGSCEFLFAAEQVITDGACPTDMYAKNIR